MFPIPADEDQFDPGATSSDSDSDDLDELVELTSYTVHHILLLLLEAEEMEEDIDAKALQDHRSGSTYNRAKAKKRITRKEAAKRLDDEYFSVEYNEVDFLRQFRVTRGVFLRIHDAIINYETETGDKYFTVGMDCSKKPGISSRVKVAVALSILGGATGTSCFSTTRAYGIGESTARLCVLKFCERVNKLYSEIFLRLPSQTEVTRVLEMHEKKWKIPGYIGSVDCMNIFWDRCPLGQQGQYRGKDGKPAIKVEALADDNLYIWSLYTGDVGSNNDINTWRSSPLQSKVVFQHYGADREFQIVDDLTVRGFPLILGDSIYENARHILKKYKTPNQIHGTYNILHSSARKAVERAFGVAQAKFKILRYPVQWQDQRHINMMVKTCFILHNIMVIRRVLLDNDPDRIVWDTSEAYSAFYAQSGESAELSALQTFEAELNVTADIVVEHRLREKERREAQTLSVSNMVNEGHSAYATLFQIEYGTEGVSAMIETRDKIAKYLHELHQD